MKALLFVLMLLLARIASAQVVISEIMYDPEGADTGHEWVEIMNQGGSSVDLPQSKFFEEGSNHSLSVVQGDTNLPGGSYAIIADDGQKFLIDHAGFLGAVLDSSFSLKNTGETISFKTPDGNISDTVTYTSDMGANGDGNSLQKMSGTWRGNVATPGLSNSEVGSFVAPAKIETQTSVSISANTLSFPTEPQIIADAGSSSRTISTGASIVFSGRVFGLKKEPIENARLAWSFGDGARGEGQGISHTYYYPGDYIVVLDASSGYYSASDRVTVHVSVPLFTLNTGGDQTHSFVAIENRGIDEIDLSLWQVVGNGKTFMFPQNTILSTKSTLTLASEISGLVTPEGSVAFLNFPNGTRAEANSPIQAKNVTTKLTKKVSIKDKPTVVAKPAIMILPQNQEASAIGVIENIQDTQTQNGSVLWPWYIGAAFFAALALLGLRLTRGEKKEKEEALVADDFEIIEDEEPH